MANDNLIIQRSGLEVAIIGIALKFPGAGTIDEFWENLKNGVESIHFFSNEELDKAGISSEIYNQPNYVKAQGLIEDKEYFDSYFFGYTPREAELMDPQMRAFHECIWTALENAACNPDTYEGSIGIYAGGTSSLFWESKSILVEGSLSNSFSTMHLTNIDFLCTRIAYKLNLKGPAINMHTACSTSLVAVDIACRDLVTGQCDMAVAGAVSMPCRRREGYFYEEQMIHSPDGHCRAFDAQARGTVGSEGLAVVVLKRLDDAIRDADTIHAVILGSAVNNDGMEKNSFTAPNIYGQLKVIRSALRTAGVPPESIGYVEAHGTGTILGDPIEVEALRLAFNSTKKGICALGSVKTNIGHLDTAAGIAGLIKTVLILKHGYIPPCLHYKAPNPAIDFTNSPFYVNNTLKKWEIEEGRIRRAGVSSFGVGGTNVHVIVEEAPAVGKVEYAAPTQSLRDRHLLLLSAHTPGALERATSNLSNYLKKKPYVDLADTAYTLQVGRKSFSHKVMVSASTVEEAVRLLDDPAIDKQLARDENRVIFMFSGQGSQYVNMGLDLYKNEPIFRQEMDICFDILNTLLNYDIKNILYSNNSVSSTEINRTEVAQPLLFIIEYALAKLLNHWGITPFAMIGHSIGEYAAACFSGVFSLKDALSLVVLRGHLMQQMPGGSMLSVPLAEMDLPDLADRELDLAAVNSTNLCVVSGSDEAIAEFGQQLEEKGHHCQKLHTSHAFHSRMMEPVLKAFEEKVGRTVLNKPEIPYISNITGTWITVEQATSPVYWARHLRETVRFGDGLTELLKEKNGLFIEVGPGKALLSMVNRHKDYREDHKIINLMRHPLDQHRDDHYLLDKIGLLWLHGQKIDWKTYYLKERRLRIQLPTYSFDRYTYPIESELLKAAMGGNIGNIFNQKAVLTKRNDMSQWFYTPSWRRSVLEMPSQPIEARSNEQQWIAFTDNGCRLSSRLVNHLKNEGDKVIEVRKGDKFEVLKEDNGKIYLVNPSLREDYETLLNTLENDGYKADRIIHLWNIGGYQEGEEKKENQLPEKIIEKGFYSLLYLTQALGQKSIEGNINITVVSSNMQEVTGEEELCPLKATLLGPVMIIPLEYPGIVCRSIDITVPHENNNEREMQLIKQLAAECRSVSKENQVAFRGNHRLVRAYDKTPLFKKDKMEVPLLRSGGVYLITGGMGGIGLVIAEYLCKQKKARLILTSGSSLPPKEQWGKYIDSNSPQDDILAGRIKKVMDLEASGVQVLVYEADVSNYERMKNVVEDAEKRLGAINGLIHCAGIPGEGIIQLKTREMVEKVFKPKVEGTLVLERIFRDRRPDFIVLCSSLNSVVPLAGQVDYMAANIFLDNFAYSYSRNIISPGTFIVSINWDTWQEVGMAADAVSRRSNFDTIGNQMDLLKHGILNKEGADAFARILGSGLSKIIVSTIDLDERLSRLGLESKEAQEPGYQVPVDSSMLARTGLKSIYAAPRNDMEQMLVESWQKVLGIGQVGIDDDFFQLGGDSLKAIQLIAWANKENLSISLPDVYKYNTIASLAGYIMTKQKESATGLMVKTYPVEEELFVKNPNFKPDIYPEYFPCMLGVIREKLKYEKGYQINKSLFLTADGATMLGYGYKYNSDISENLKYLEFPYAAQLGKFKNITEALGFKINVRRFTSLEEEREYLAERLKKKESVILTGTTYFLNYSPDYYMDEMQWLRKMDELFTSYDTSKKLELLGHLFLLVDMTEEHYIIFDSTYNYYGKVPLDNVHKAITGNSAIQFTKGHISYDSYPPYQVVEIVTDNLMDYDEKAMMIEIMKKIVDISIQSLVFKHQEKDAEYIVCLGLGSIKELAAFIENFINKKEQYGDLLLYMTKIIKTWKYKNMAFRDFLTDLVKYVALPGEIFTDMEAAIGSWNGLEMKIQDKKGHEDELFKIFSQSIEQIGKIYQEQQLLFLKLKQSIAHV